MDYQQQEGMTIRQAIEKAIEGGWKDTKASDYFLNYRGELVDWRGESSQAMAFLDPLFWQSLGKSLGWKEHEKSSKERYKYYPDGSVTMEYPNTISEWLYQWHRFIDHLAEGKDAESFFKSL